MLRLSVVATFAFAILGTSASAQEKAPAAKREESPITLKVGDPAPPLKVEKWVKGAPVETFPKGKVSVVEFWATWCGPCIASMPHLSELQREHKARGVTVIGVTSVDPDNSLESVEEMVKSKGDGMGYAVAWDAGRATNEAYMKASGQRGIPCSFVVDGEGRIAYIGHPMWLDEPIEQITAGTWDLAKAPEFVKKMTAELNAVFSKRESDPKAAMAAFESFRTKHPKAASMFESMPFELSLASGDFEAASKSGRALLEKKSAARDANALNELAWTIVDPDSKWAKRDLDLAMDAATKACELTSWKDGMILDTLARVHFRKGEVKKAIEIQTKAVELAKGASKESLTTTLEEYKKAGAQ